MYYMYCNVATINYDEKGRNITNRVLKPMHRAFYNNIVAILQYY